MAKGFTVRLKYNKKEGFIYPFSVAPFSAWDLSVFFEFPTGNYGNLESKEWTCKKFPVKLEFPLLDD